ncbi:MAG: DNA polymerase III subunit beta, partial [Candidatus Algichlamydia australiensis]|nr:DNA polymerase III subunit beta [Chlamydiales bacterium]
EIESGNLTFVGTDGKRLAKIFTAVPDAGEFTTKMILPLKAVEEMSKILDLGDEAKLTIFSDRVSLEVGHATLITKLIAGDFPDVERVIPEQTQAKKVILHREELMTLLRQTALFTSEEVNSVRFHFSDAELELYAASGEIGEGKVSMPVDYHGGKIEVAFNPHILLNILRHLSGETFTFSLIDAYNPGLLTDKSNALFVVMPMRLS